MASRNAPIVPCPECTARCINHKTFTSTRVADYANKRFMRYFRCGPLDKGRVHEEHEWPVVDVRPGQSFAYSELGDDRERVKK